MTCRLGFAAGLLEGDGHIQVSQKNGLTINLVCVSEPLIRWYWQLCRDVVGTHIPEPRYQPRSGSGFWSLTVIGRKAEVLGHALLPNGGAMERKWNVLRHALTKTHS